MQKLWYFLMKIIYFFALLIFGYIFLLNLLQFRITGIDKFFLLLSILLLSFVSVKYIKKIKHIDFINKNYIAILFGLAFVIRVITLLIIRPVPISDFQVLLEAAFDFSNGTNVLNSSSYFQLWSYQSWLVLYQAIVLKIFGNQLALHLIDCMFTAGICVLIYKIGKNMFKSNNKVASLLYALSIYAITYAGVLSNQHIFTFLLLLVINMIVTDTTKLKNIYLKYALIGLLIALANLFRAEGILLILAFVIFEFMYLLYKKLYLQFFQKVGVVLVVYLFITSSASFLIKATNINHNGLVNNDPLWKFVCGSDFESGGGYSARGLKYIGNKVEEWQFILDNYRRLSFREHIEFIQIKIENFWVKESYHWSFSKYYNDNQKPLVIEYFAYVDKIVYIMVLFAVLVSLYYGFLNVKENNKQVILILFLLITFAIYLLIEVQPRYSYTAKVMLFILAMNGFAIIDRYISSKKFTN